MPPHVTVFPGVQSPRGRPCLLRCLRRRLRQPRSSGLVRGPLPASWSLDHGGVLVYVFLAGEPHELVHDFVGHGPLDQPVLRHAVVAAEVQRLRRKSGRSGGCWAGVCRWAGPCPFRSSPQGSPGPRPAAPAWPRPLCRGRAARRGCACLRDRSPAGRRVRTSLPACSDIADAAPPERSIGSWLLSRKNRAVSRPLSPFPVKYSDLARKITGRGTISGRKIESENDRWLEAMMAAPLRERCPVP